jgi:nucleoside-diphosphate-sugar epimerase
MRFSAAGHRGVVLRLGLLYGPGTGASEPIEDATGGDLHVQDAGTGLLFALSAPAGIYNLVADNSRISNDRYKRATGWAPTHSTGGKRK